MQRILGRVLVSEPECPSRCATGAGFTWNVASFFDARGNYAVAACGLAVSRFPLLGANQGQPHGLRFGCAARVNAMAAARIARGQQKGKATAAFRRMIELEGQYAKLAQPAASAGPVYLRLSSRQLNGARLNAKLFRRRDAHRGAAWRFVGNLSASGRLRRGRSGALRGRRAGPNRRRQGRRRTAVDDVGRGGDEGNRRTAGEGGGAPQRASVAAANGCDG
jgi:hypothetical protein